MTGDDAKQGGSVPREDLEELIEKWENAGPRMAAGGNSTAGHAFQTCAQDLRKVIRDAE